MAAREVTGGIFQKVGRELKCGRGFGTGGIADVFRKRIACKELGIAEVLGRISKGKRGFSLQRFGVRAILGCGGMGETL
jgi:hypothetical protein